MVAACRSRTASEGKACPQLQVMWAWPGIMPRGRGEGVGRRAPIRGGERGPSLPIGLVGPGNTSRGGCQGCQAIGTQVFANGRQIGRN